MVYGCACEASYAYWRGLNKYHYDCTIFLTYSHGIIKLIYASTSCCQLFRYVYMRIHMYMYLYICIYVYVDITWTLRLHGGRPGYWLQVPWTSQLTAGTKQTVMGSGALNNTHKVSP